MHRLSALPNRLLLLLLVAAVSTAGLLRATSGTAPPARGVVVAQSRCGAGASGDGIVLTDAGAVRGVQDGGAVAFKGIPYAAAPVGPLRWQPPQEAPCWDGVREAAAFGPACLQLSEQGTVQGEEDCLTLNVWTPNHGPDEAGMPVLVFIHGGGNAQGTASQPVYDGRRLAEQFAVVVTLEYRLGPLGFLALPQFAAERPEGAAGNDGILDQIAALRWVQRNIAAFGGDPARVMVFGESAGAVDTCVLLASPLAAGLFSRAAMESGACLGPAAMRANHTGERFLTASPCADAADVPACLRALPAEDVLRILPASVSVVSAGANGYGPVVDGHLLTASPLETIRAGRHNAVPFLIGSNADETGQATGPVPSAEAYRAAVSTILGPALAARVLAMYPVADYSSPRAAFVAATSDARFTCPTRTSTRAVAANQSLPVFRYFFTQRLRGAGAALGSFHGLELAFVFGTLGQGGAFTPNESEQALIAAMQGYWVRFAAAGDPNGGDTAPWPAYEPTTDPYLELGPTIAAGAGVRTAQCDFWDGLAP